MKVCFICADSDIPVLGHEGCSIHVRELAHGFVEAGHEAVVLCSWLGGDATPPAGIPVHLIEPRGLDASTWQALERDPVVQETRLTRDLRSILFNSWLVEQGAAILDAQKPDFIYERHSLFNGGGWRLSRRFGIPYITEVNAPMCDEQEGYELFPLIHAAREWEVDLLGRSDAIIVVSAWLKEWMAGKGVQPEKVQVIQNAVAGRLFETPASGDEVRRRHGLEGRPTVGFVGSFQSWHDARGLVEAFHRVRGKQPDARLVMVGGGGPDRPAVMDAVRKHELSDAVIFVGAVPHDRVPQYLAAFDVVAAPFKQVWNYKYGSPLKLFESMGAGRPTLAASVGQVSELIEHGQTGWLYPPGDVEKMAEGICALLDDRERAARIGAAARAKILKDHTWQSVARKIVALAAGLKTP